MPVKHYTLISLASLAQNTPSLTYINSNLLSKPILYSDFPFSVINKWPSFTKWPRQKCWSHSRFSNLASSPNWSIPKSQYFCLLNVTYICSLTATALFQVSVISCLWNFLFFLTLYLFTFDLSYTWLLHNHNGQSKGISIAYRLESKLWGILQKTFPVGVSHSLSRIINHSPLLVSCTLAQ